MGFTYLHCSGSYGCTGTTRRLIGGRRPLTGPPMLWRVLWQPGPLDQGVGGTDVLVNLSHGSVTDFFG